MIYKILLSSTLLLSVCFATNAQVVERSILSNAGSLFINESLSIEFTLGEIATETFSNNQLILTQGFNQPDFQEEINIKNELSKYNWTIYPNPAKQSITVTFNNKPDLNYQEIYIHDLHGRLVLKKQLFEKSSIININSIQPGTYLVKSPNNQNTILLQIIE